MKFHHIPAILLCAGLVGICPAFAADDDEAPAKRPELGLRFTYLPLRSFSVGSATASTSVPAAYYEYTGTSNNSRAVIGPTVEYRVSHHFILGLELHFHKPEYRQTTKMWSGRDDSTATTETRNLVASQQTTKVNYWELPVMVHYLGLRSHGWLSRTYLTGGLNYRHVGRIRTANAFWYPDGSTDYNETTPLPKLVNQLGFVVGVGLRSHSLYHVRVAPEMRFVRWRGMVFEGPAYRGERNQLEAGLGFSF